MSKTAKAAKTAKKIKTCDSYCRRCRYVERQNTICCYYLQTGRRRGCPAGLGCTRRESKAGRLLPPDKQELERMKRAPTRPKEWKDTPPLPVPPGERAELERWARQEMAQYGFVHKRPPIMRADLPVMEIGAAAGDAASLNAMAAKFLALKLDGVIVTTGDAARDKELAVRLQKSGKWAHGPVSTSFDGRTLRLLRRETVARQKAALKEITQQLEKETKEGETSENDL